MFFLPSNILSLNLLPPPMPSLRPPWPLLSSVPETSIAIVISILTTFSTAGDGGLRHPQIFFRRCSLSPRCTITLPLFSFGELSRVFSPNFFFMISSIFQYFPFGFLSDSIFSLWIFIWIFLSKHSAPTASIRETVLQLLVGDEDLHRQRRLRHRASHLCPSCSLIAAALSDSLSLSVISRDFPPNSIFPCLQFFLSLLNYQNATNLLLSVEYDWCCNFLEGKSVNT